MKTSAPQWSSRGRTMTKYVGYNPEGRRCVTQNPALWLLWFEFGWDTYIVERTTVPFTKVS